ncbi:MAG: SH3 domain-containing protein [Candidatus Riflebacteria bacterium]|nr:SH3 domain-containing protein [Candidatus Riflebacteria bacterium]
MSFKRLFFLGLVIVVIGYNPGYSQDTISPFSDALIQLDGSTANRNTSEALGVAAIQQVGIVRAKWLLNVRAAPWGKIIDGYKPGRQVQIVGREGDWYKIIRGNGYAYVHTSLIELKQENSDSASQSAQKPAGNSTAFVNKYGPDSKGYQKIFDLIKKFCNANKAYVLGAAHGASKGIVEKSDCSGFTSQFIQKISAMAGVKPVTGSSYPSSTNFAKSNYTKKITPKVPPTNPRDLVRPGDIFVMKKGGSYGHVGIFMGYDSAGRPLIAHSTTRVSKKGVTVCGNIGTTGVRIEPIPSWYKERWMGVYRLNNMDKIMNNLEA